MGRPRDIEHNTRLQRRAERLAYRVALAAVVAFVGGIVILGCKETPAGEEPTGCDPECAATQVCVDHVCVEPPGCDPACGPEEHCSGTLCVPNLCDPPCGTDEVCMTHDSTDCHCPSPPCGEQPPTDCTDALDNDGDGWIDDLDPDCDLGDEELGLSASTCNDGVDNDGDGAVDAADPECGSGGHDEVLGDGLCVDVCHVGAEDGGRVCQLWDAAASTWSATVQDATVLHHRARNYTSWLRERLMPEGGVMRGYFTDATFDQAWLWAGTRDSPIWTGIYLASEALRYLVTGAPDAAAQIDETVRVIDRWWRISGDQGYLARYAAPVSSPQPVLNIFDASDPENHRDVAFEGDTWHWKGNISRDQYQGVMLGYSFAYEATSDPALKEMIRSNVVSFIEKLMVFETRQINLTVDGVPLNTSIEMGHAVYTDDETPNGIPALEITTSPFDAIDSGFLIFWPNPSEFLRQVPLLSWLPDFYLRSQAIQLGSMFTVALKVTEGVPAYAARRQAILAHYESYVDEWMDMAAGWANSNNCGDSYHGLNIAFTPAWNWARLEPDPTRRARLQTEVLRDAMWGEVFDHKNVFFAYIYASQANPADNVTGVISDHTDALRMFPSAPNSSHPVDNTAEYAENPSCPGISSVAVDLDDRVPSTFMWERQPWKLVDAGEPNKLYSGVDYLITYWMARYYGYLPDDSPDQCLRWH